MWERIYRSGNFYVGGDEDFVRWDFEVVDGIGNGRYVYGVVDCVG